MTTSGFVLFCKPFFSSIPFQDIFFSPSFDPEIQQKQLFALNLSLPFSFKCKYLNCFNKLLLRCNEILIFVWRALSKHCLLVYSSKNDTLFFNVLQPSLCPHIIYSLVKRRFFGWKESKPAFISFSLRNFHSVNMSSGSCQGGGRMC